MPLLLLLFCLNSNLIFSPDGIRFMTPREIRIAQGFPPNFVLHGPLDNANRVYALLGNAGNECCCLLVVVFNFIYSSFFYVVPPPLVAAVSELALRAAGLTICCEEGLALRLAREALGWDK